MELSEEDQFCEAESALLDGGAGDSGPPCPTDPLEPNQSVENPADLPIPEQGDEYTSSGLYICPETDVDVFRFDVDVTGKNARIEVSYAERGELEELEVHMLNSAGVSIRAATPVGGDNGELRADFANLAQGVYYAEVKGTGETRVEYTLHVLTTSDELPP
ncbi:MAG TPA: hypothetical protein VKZ63_06425 [Kofleriaceae bacterium]|nr:hypothetical protein [Kofleriaceae bacterium]